MTQCKNLKNFVKSEKIETERLSKFSKLVGDFNSILSASIAQRENDQKVNKQQIFELGMVFVVHNLQWKIMKMAKKWPKYDQKWTGLIIDRKWNSQKRKWTFSKSELIHISNENGHDLTENSQILVKFWSWFGFKAKCECPDLVFEAAFWLADFLAVQIEIESG